MQGPVVLLLALFTLPTGFLKAQENSQQPNGTTSSLPRGSNSMVVNLLQQSHDLNPQFSLGARIDLLGRQAETISRVDAELAQAWAQELLALAGQTTGSSRSMAENSAMTILARLNPDRALLLLHSLSKADPPKNLTPSLPNMRLVQTVFDVLVTRDGSSALAALEEEAERMGADGTYPYKALGHAAVQSVSTEWSTNRPDAVEVVQKVFDRAFQRYCGGSHGYFEDYEFGKMLQEVAGGLPHESVKPALRVLVKNLLATDTSKYRFEAGVYTEDGKTAKADNAIDAAILNLGGLINRIDPELAQQLESTRPELQTALQYTQDGQARLSFFNGGARPLNSRPPNPDVEAGMDAMRLANINPEAAIAKAKQLPEGDRRADTLLEIARDIAGSQPERAQELIAEIEDGNKTGIPELQLDVISAKASVAAAQGKKERVRELLQQGFALANPIIMELQKGGGISYVAGIGQLVQIGMQNDSDSTIAFLQSIPMSWLKANYLLGAASAVISNTRLPIGSRELQKPAKSNEKSN